MEYKKIDDMAYDGNDFETINIDEQTLMPKQQISVSERLELAKKLQSLGVVNIDKRIYSKKNK